MSDRYFRNTETNEITTVIEGADASVFETELISDTTNLRYVEVPTEAEDVAETSADVAAE